MASKFDHIPLLSLNRWENPNKLGTGFELRVVHMVQDGKSKGVGVEKVYFYDDGKKFIGKPMQLKDLETVFGRREEIKFLAKNPPPVPPPPEPEPLSGGSLGGDGTWGDRTGLGGGSIGGGSIEREEF